MKLKNIFLLSSIFTILLINNTLYTDPTDQQVEQIAHQLFNPTLSNYPITSINETTVDALYGPSGLNVDSLLVTNIKKFYFYIEYITRLEIAAKLLTCAKENNLESFYNALFSWDALINALLKKTNQSSWDNLLSLIRSNTPDWDDIRSVISNSLKNDNPALFNQTTSPVITFDLLTKSSFWQKIPLTTNDLILSDFWQNYLKFTIYGSYQIDSSLTQSIGFNEKFIFKYLPTIEIAYYELSFSKLRQQSELLRVSSVLNESFRTRLKAQTIGWNNLDDITLYNTAQSFTSQLFYEIAEASTNVLSTSSYSPFYTDAQGNTQLKTNIKLPAPYPEYMSCLAMIMLLQKMTYKLFEPQGSNADKLTQTVSILKTIPTQPTPSLLIYTPQDYIALEDLTGLIQSISQLTNNPTVAIQSLPSYQTTKQQEKQNENNTVEVENFISDVTAVWNDIKDLATKAWASIEDIGNALTDDAKIFYYSSGLANLIQHISPDQAQQLSDAARSAASNDWDSFRKDADGIIDDLVKIDAFPTKAIIDGTLDLINQGLEALHLSSAASDLNKLENNFDTFYDSAVEMSIDAMQAAADLFITSAQGLSQLTADGIALITKVSIDIAPCFNPTLSSQCKIQNIPSDLLDSLKDLAADTISTLLEVATVAISDVKKAFGAILKAAGNLIQFLVDAFIDIVSYTSEAGAAFANIFGANVNPQTIQADVAQQLDEHRRLISQIITTGLLIGATVLTGGGALSIAMMAGFGAFGIVGSAQDDTQAQERAAEQELFLDNYQQYITNKEKIESQGQIFLDGELSKKFAAQLNNQERSLGFYQNFLNQTLFTIKDRLNGFLGSYQAALLTQDPATTLIPADVGSIYGIQTGFYDLNISQGFSLYSMARNTIAQEIAESPKHMVIDPTQGTENAKFWFNQRITKDVSQTSEQPLTIELRFQTFYLLDSFYVGAYIGGSPLNTNKILTTHQGDLDRPQYAKMLVYNKESSDSPTICGLYEYESEQSLAQQNWLSTSIQAPALTVGTWYHVKAQLNNTQLQIKIWQESGQEPSDWQTFTVTPCPQQTVGMVFSGAAGEFQLLNPLQQPTIVASVRKEDPTIPTEKQRSLDARVRMNRLLLPQDFNTLSLAPISISDIIKGHYIYTITENQQTDYLTTANFTDDHMDAVDNINQIPTASSNALVSIITGKAYANQNNALVEQTWVPTIGTMYKNTFTKLSDATLALIDTADKAYAQQLIGPTTGYAFGPYNITLTGIQEANNHQFIYKTINNGPILTDNNNNPLKDSAGKLLYDNYFITASLIQAGSQWVPSTDIGRPYNDLINKTNITPGLISLITGNVYISTQASPVSTGYQLSASQALGTLDSVLKATITKAQNDYQTTLAQANQPLPKPVPLVITPVPLVPSTGGTGNSSGLGFDNTNSSSQSTSASFNQRQQAASNSDDDFGT